MCSETGSTPCIIDTDGECSNGIPGLQTGNACCPTMCGECGGPYCQIRGEGCCTNQVFNQRPCRLRTRRGMLLASVWHVRRVRLPDLRRRVLPRPYHEKGCDVQRVGSRPVHYRNSGAVKEEKRSARPQQGKHSQKGVYTFREERGVLTIGSTG
ncbi:unnamed protein product [Ascophyllum nodosum]